MHIITFIGWHDSGKTTLATRVVSHLKAQGYRIGVIKSTKDTEIPFDTPGTDSARHREAGAEGVLLVAPDQMMLTAQNNALPLSTLAHRFFPDVDLVIGEGFKYDPEVKKIEVVREQEKLLRDEVTGVVAVATDLPLTGGTIFRLQESEELALYIVKLFCLNSQ